MYLYLKSLHDH
jgi:hypothetical protein